MMVKFYYGSGSPYAWRVQLVLEEKSVPYEPVLLSFSAGDHKKPEHLARHPHGKVPAITDDGLTIYESTPIVEYLEERYAERPLLPRDPAARARVRMEEFEAALYFGDAFRDVGRLVFFTPPAERDAAAIESARAKVRELLHALEARTKGRGQFLTGDTLTRADLAWLPFVELAARGGVELDATTPSLRAWRDRMRERPSYARSYPPHWKK
jgi:glutathione S-transferase